METLETLYASHPLVNQKRAIRIIYIEAANGSSVIRGRMSVINLDENPRFSVLSYVWGPFSSPRNQILCDGHMIDVTTNCWNALSQLCAHFGALSIWVDAICINQQDDREKESQIPLMRDIYGLAAKAYIWLGSGNVDSDKAIDYLSVAGFQQHLTPRSGIHYKVPTDATVLWRISWFMTFKNMVNAVKYLRYNNATPWGFIQMYFWSCFSLPDSCVESRALEDFFSRDWCTRIWTLQEAVLASNPVLCCGSRVLSWRSAIHAIAFIDHASRNYVAFIPEDSVRVWKRIVLLWCHVNPVFPMRPSHDSLVDLQSFLPEYYAFLDRCARNRRITAFTIAVSTDIALLVAMVWINSRLYDDVSVGVAFLMTLPAVLIYTPLGVLFFWIWFDPIFRSIAAPAVTWKPASKTVSVPISLRAAIVQEALVRKATNGKDKSFGLYSILEKLGLQLDAPNYDKPLSTVFRELFSELLRWNHSLGLIVYAGGTKPGFPSWLPDWQVDPKRSWFDPADTLVNGAGLHRATGASSPSWTWPSDKCLCLKGFIVSSILECSDEFWCDDSVNEDNPEVRNAFLHDANLVRKFSVFGEPVLSGYESIDRGQKEATEQDLSLLSGVLNGPYRRAMYHDLRLKRRILFRTSIPGRTTAGNCPTAAVVGDKIALVAGVSVPLVLRSEGDSYKLIGAAEVDGLMKGELWEDPLEEDLEDLMLI